MGKLMREVDECLVYLASSPAGCVVGITNICSINKRKIFLAAFRLFNG